MKALATKPESKWNPSLRSRLVWIERAASTVIEPSLPTQSTALAIRLPMVSSLLAEMVAMCAMSSSLWMGIDASFKLPTSTSVALSIARLISMGGTPATTCFCASCRIARASTIDVVVPSPARAFVWLDACFKIWTAAFSMGSSSTTWSATVTPSLLTNGRLPACCSRTVLPLGPSVDATLSARIFTPLRTLALSSAPEE